MSKKKRKNQSFTLAPPDPVEKSSRQGTRKSPSLQLDSSGAALSRSYTRRERLAEESAEPVSMPTYSQSAAIAFVAACAAVMAWAYWPTLAALVATWIREPDYTHGWLVIPLTAYLLWDRRGSMPPIEVGVHIGGLLLLGTIVLARVFARWAYFDFVDGWTLPLCAMGLAWIFGGRRWFAWSLPALAFLFFMIPLPFRLENEMSRPLQWIATNLSTATLQVMGQPAIPEGTTILLGEHNLEVERACSGLRIFMGVIALAYVYSLLVRGPWWEKVLLMVAAIPIALVANSARIVVTGLCYQWISNEAGKHFAHDFAGILMIGVAALLFYAVLHYQRWLVQEVVEADTDLIRLNREPQLG
jgi:exosortase